MSDLQQTTINSPIGPLDLTATEHGLRSVSFSSKDPSEEKPVKLSPALLNAKNQLAEFFAGQRKGFDLKLDLSGLSNFQASVLDQLRKISYGTTSSYGELAKQIGKPKAARAVGGALNRNPLAIVIPCHRVVGSNGDLTGFAGNLTRKQWLLDLESAK